MRATELLRRDNALKASEMRGQRLRQQLTLTAALFNCTLSIGYAFFPTTGPTAAISLENAISLVDKALYEAKHRGRDRDFRAEPADARALAVVAGTAGAAA